MAVRRTAAARASQHPSVRADRRQVRATDLDAVAGRVPIGPGGGLGGPNADPRRAILVRHQPAKRPVERVTFAQAVKIHGHVRPAERDRRLVRA